MNRTICGFVLFLFQYGLFVSGCYAAQADSSKAYLDHLVEVFDRGKLQTGLIHCEVNTDNVKQEAIVLVFKKDRFLKRMQTIAGNQPRVTCQWFDGLHAVRGIKDEKWRFVIEKPRYDTTELSMVFLGEVFHYWDKKDSSFPNLNSPAREGLMKEWSSLM